MDFSSAQKQPKPLPADTFLGSKYRENVFAYSALSVLIAGLKVRQGGREGERRKGRGRRERGREEKGAR